MSTWTHVNSCIRFDALRILGESLPDLGKTCTFDSTDEEWEACTVPCGSEGSLQYAIWENPSDCSLAAYTVSIFGDLRDFEEEDHHEITEYFDRIIKGALVRQGQFSTLCDGVERLFIIAHDENGGSYWKEILNA